MHTYQDYNRLVRDLKAVEDRIEAAQPEIIVAYLSDVGVDHENTRDSGFKDPNADEYWDMMYRQAANAAGTRAQELRIDINAELGYVIY